MTHMTFSQNNQHFIAFQVIFLIQGENLWTPDPFVHHTTLHLCCYLSFLYQFLPDSITPNIITFLSREHLCKELQTFLHVEAWINNAFNQSCFFQNHHGLFIVLPCCLNMVVIQLSKMMPSSFPKFIMPWGHYTQMSSSRSP